MGLKEVSALFSNQRQGDLAAGLPALLLSYLPHAAVALVYAAAAIAGLQHAVVGSTITLIWAPSGIALAAMLIWGYPMAPCVAAAALAANLWTDVPLAVASGIAFGNTLAAMAGAWLLARVPGFSTALSRRRDVLALIALAAFVATTISASVGISTLALAQLLPPEGSLQAWLKWWLGDMMGVLVVAPVLLVWLGRRAINLSPLKIVEAIVLSIALVGLSYLIFGPPEVAGRGYYPAALAVFPLVIWAALSFGQLGASLLSLTVSMLAVVGTAEGTGPFVIDQPVDSLVRWCVFAIVVAVTGLLLAASVHEQRRAQAELRKSHAELEQQVGDRTRDLLGLNADLRREMSERRNLESELIRVSEVQQQAMGRELHDGLGQHLTSLALLSAALQQRLAQREASEAEAAARIVSLASEANAMTRSLAKGLYPVALEFGGLFAALERLAEQASSLHGIRCEFHGEPGAQVNDSMVALNLYRVAQEAVNNAMKYSKATRVRIELSGDGARHCLCVSDDGIGIDLDRIVLQHGLGMHSMRYRANLLGGDLKVEPQPSGGTRIVVTVSGLRSTP
jgi:two-component system, NarL family, sensor histidine kinase FusK